MNYQLLYSCCSQNQYLGVSVEHFDSLGGDEEIHLCHGLRLTLRRLHTDTHTTVNEILDTPFWMNRFSKLQRTVNKN